MRLEHCKIERFDDETYIDLGFSIPSKLTPELVTEIGRRIEHFLAPFHTPASEPADTDPQTGSGFTLEQVMSRNSILDDLVFVASPEEEDSPSVVKTTRRTRAPKAEAPEPAEPVAEITPAPRRTRTPKAEAPEPTEPIIEEEIIPAPAPRRTRAPAPVAAPEITDMDLAKAASGAAEVLGTQIVKDIIAEMGVKTVNEIEGFEKRQYFLGLLDAEKKLAEEEKANG